MKVPMINRNVLRYVKKVFRKEFEFSSVFSSSEYFLSSEFIFSKLRGESMEAYIFE